LRPALLLLVLLLPLVVFELELVLFFDPLELEPDLVGMTLSLPARINRSSVGTFRPNSRKPLSLLACWRDMNLRCSPLVPQEQIRYKAVHRRGSAAMPRAQ
jgi:hypothetical protein